MLRKKLIRRGVTVGSIGALTTLLSTEAGAAVLPATFVSATVQAASLAATGKLAAGVGTGVVSAKVAALTKGAIQMMFIAQLKTAALITAACVVVAGSGAVVAKEMLVPSAAPVVAQAEPKGLPPPTPATNDTATIAWGAVTNELQAGLVPLGGITGWKGFLCPNHPPGTKLQPISSAIAARNRHCVGCVALKPWSATFIEGEPMRMELHFRNLAKEVVNLYDARYGGCWRFAFTPVGGGTSWQAGWAIKDIRRAESFAQSTIQLAAGQQNAVELDLGPGWMFSDPQGRQPAIRSLPVGKYTMTATYAHPDHAQRKICTYWHGTVTTGTVQIEIKADDAEARFLEAAKYAGFAAVAEVKALPQAEQAGNAVKLSQLGIEWKELLYAPEPIRQTLSVVNALTFPNSAAAELKIGDRILVADDKVTRYVLPRGGTLKFEGQSPEVLPNNGGALLDGAQWLLWTQSRQDALLAALAPGWRKGRCPWCIQLRGTAPLAACQFCQKKTSGSLCSECAIQRGACTGGGGECKRTVGPATPGVTFRLWAYDPNGERNGTPRNECRIRVPNGGYKPGFWVDFWVEVQNEKGETPEFQTPGGGAAFDLCGTLFCLIEGPGISSSMPAFPVMADHSALPARAALRQGSATGQIHLMEGKLFTTPGTYTVRAVAGRLVSSPVKVEVAAYTPEESAERAAQADAIYRQGLAELEAALKAAAAGASFDDLKAPYKAIEKQCGQLTEFGAKELSDRLRRDLQTRLEPRMKDASK
jgi:hypothetical protein